MSDRSQVRECQADEHGCRSCRVPPGQLHDPGCGADPEQIGEEAEKPRAHRLGQTHYEGCWKTRGHHNCAVKKVRELEEQLAEEVEAVHDELKSLDVEMRGPGRPKYREVARRIGNIVTKLANEHGFGPPGSAEPPRGPGRKGP